MSQQITLVKDTRQLVIQTVRTDGDTGGGVLAISVVDIDDPSAELNLIAGTLKGDLRLCYQERATGDDWTMYAWDDADSDAENVPWVVDGLTGKWNAIAGRNHYNGVRGREEFTAFGGSAKEISLGITTIASASTGVVRADGFTVGTPTSDLDVGAGFGHIVDIHTDPANPVWTEVSWAAQTITITDLTDFTLTFVFVDSSGTIQQQTTAPTVLELRENIHLGFVAIVGGGILQIVDDPYIATGAAVQLSTLMDAIGSINLSVAISNGSTDLSVALSGGDIHIRGSNFDDTVAGRGDPNTKTFPAANPQEIGYLTQNLSILPTVFLIDPLNFDNGGTVTVIGGSNNQATNQRIWIFPNGVVGVQYGTIVYNTLTNAVAGSSTEAFIDNPVLADAGALLLATLSVKKGATDLSDMDDARFLPGGKFGEASVGGSGQAVTSLQQAYSNSLDGTIITDVTRTAVKFQRGTALDTDDVFEVLNGAGAQTFGVTGAGVVTPSAVGLGGHTINDVLISTDGLSVSNTAFLTPGYLDNLYASLDDLAVVAATVITDHGGLTGLLDDHHTQYLLVDGTRAMTGNLLLGLTQRLVFDDNGDTHINSPLDDQLQFTVGAAQKMLMGVSGITIDVPALFPAGTAPAPSVAVLQSDKGLFSPATDELGISTAGVVAVRYDASQNQINSGVIFLTDGTAADPSVSFSNSPTTGLFSAIANNLGFSWGGLERLRGGGGVLNTFVDFLPGSDKFYEFGGVSNRWKGIFGESLDLEFDAIGVAETAGLLLANSSDAAPAAQQFSPMFVQQGEGWKTDVTAETQTVQFAQQVEPIQGAANPTGELVFKSSINGGAYTDVFNINSVGDVHIGPESAFPTLFFSASVNTFIKAQAATMFIRLGGTGTQHSFGTARHLLLQASTSAASAAFSMTEAGNGLYRPTTNETGITTGGTQAVRWDASQVQINASDILPDVDSANDLGSTSLRWANLWVDDITLTAAVNIGGDLNHDGTLIGLYGATPVAQSAAYTLNATAVLDRTLLASASATTINNNNVIAALVTDLQALGALG